MYNKLGGSSTTVTDSNGLDDTAYALAQSQAYRGGVTMPHGTNQTYQCKHCDRMFKTWTLFVGI